MKYWVYILESDTSGRKYCGQTQDLFRRLSEHNDPEFWGTKTTKRFPGPWRLLWSTVVETRSEAMRLERHIKKRGIQRFLEGLSSGSEGAGGC